MNYRTFEDNQNKIYEQDIFGYNWLEKGIEKDKKITFDIEGILVGLGFNKKLRNHLAKTSRKIAEVIPAMVFSENELHTSLIYVRTNEKASDFSAIKGYLFETYEHAIQKGFDIPEILFRKPTLTKNGAIMPGLAGKNFFLLMEMLYCQYFLKVPQEIEGKNTKKLIKGWGGIKHF